MQTYLSLGPYAVMGRASSTLGFPHDESDAEQVETELELTVPFSSNTFEILMEKFALPSATPWTIWTQVYHFYQHASRRDRIGSPPPPRGRDLGTPITDQAGYTLRIPTKRMISMNLALSVSHCPQSRLTFALLLGLSDAQQAFILDQLKSPGIVPHAAHPLLLPVLLTCHHEALLHERVAYLWDRLIVGETESGQTGVPDPDLAGVWGGQWKRRDVGSAALTRHVLGIAQVSFLWESEVQTLLQNGTSMRASIRALMEIYKRGKRAPLTKMDAEAARFLRDLLAKCDKRAQTALSGFGFLSKRAEAQMNAVRSNLSRWCWKLKSPDFLTEIRYTITLPENSPLPRGTTAPP